MKRLIAVLMVLLGRHPCPATGTQQTGGNMRIAVTALVLACVPAPACAQPNQGPEAAIREQHGVLATAINKRDAAAVAAFFTPETVTRYSLTIRESWVPTQSGRTSRRNSRPGRPPNASR